MQKTLVKEQAPKKGTEFSKIFWSPKSDEGTDSIPLKSKPQIEQIRFKTNNLINTI